MFQREEKKKLSNKLTNANRATKRISAKRSFNQNIEPMQPRKLYSGSPEECPFLAELLQC